MGDLVGSLLRLSLLLVVEGVCGTSSIKEPETADGDTNAEKRADNIAMLEHNPRRLYMSR